MGFTTRLRNGLSRFLATPQPRINHPHNSMSLNEMRTFMSNRTPMEEALPGLSQPVWGPEISTVGAYSREGYTSKPFDSPLVTMRIQSYALQVDEDVQLSINHLASKVTGGSHYVKAKNNELVEHFEHFTKAMNFDTFDTETVKELLWFGNSIYKPRMGIRNVERFSDLMHIPISSFVKIWWDRSRIPYKYEFRGSEYQGYHNPEEIIHFMWNPINASVIGTGFGISMTAPRRFTQITPTGEVQVDLPPLLERKYATQRNMQFAEQRYISRNVWTIESGSEEDRGRLQAQVEDLQVGQDVVAGTKVSVLELGSQGKNFNAEQFTDITMGPIMKALNDFRAKEAGSSSHSYANAETSAILDEIGLSSFPTAVKEQMEEKLFKPWYQAHPTYDPSYMMGMIPIPFDETNFDIEFGEQEKTDISQEDMQKLLELWIQAPVIKDPVELRKLFEQAGLPLTKELDSQMDIMYNDPNGQMALNNVGMSPNMMLPQHDLGGGEIPPSPDFTSGTTPPPNDMEIYNSMAQQIRPDVQRSYKRSNQSQPWDIGDYSA